MSWNEIRSRAIAFVAEWRGETRERAEAQSFWNDWFHVFGQTRRRVATFEQAATRASTNNRGDIDLFWPGMLAVEHKSAGKSLEAAIDQALDYLFSIGDSEMPRMVISSDFDRFRVLDLDLQETVEFPLEEFPDNIERFDFLAGYRRRTFEDQDEVNVRAAQLLGRFYDHVEEGGYSGHQLRVLVVRLLFLLFSDDTGVWPRGQFQELIETRTSEDGSDLGPLLIQLFETLDKPESARQKALLEEMAALPYINGGIFAERIDTPALDTEARSRLLQCSAFDWSAISPAIFGSMFQSVMDKDERRVLGAHYTTEANIMKVIEPLFMDELRAEFAAAGRSLNKLKKLHQRLSGLTFFDPAAGCGNFLVLSYRELRRLEFDILTRIRDVSGSHAQQALDASHLSVVQVDQFYAIEIEEFPALIAQTALYLMDHLENMRLSKEFGDYYTRFPIRTETNIRIGNACRIDWDDVLPREKCSYLLGNPPFRGRQFRSPEQQEDMCLAHGDLKGSGVLDYVTAWYSLAERYMRGSGIRAALVSTNSITQGENVSILWPHLLAAGVHIDFAHRTFKWSSEARGGAAVHVVIIGFSFDDRPRKPVLYDYPDIAGQPVARTAKNINPYLADAPDLVVEKRRRPLVEGIPPTNLGSMPNDGGNLLIADADIETIRRDEIASKYLRCLIGSEELINNGRRWCLWLVDADPADLRRSPILNARIEAVRRHRLASKREATQRLADTPYLFGEVRQPENPYLAIPEVSSENRAYLPCAILGPETIVTNKIYVVPDADPYLFGMVSSRMMTAWQGNVGGRLESRWQFSAGLVYNTFPFPEITAAQRLAVASAAGAVLAARAEYPNASLADLYAQSAMPKSLIAAHRALDKAVDTCFTKAKMQTDAERLKVLFDRYELLSKQT